MNFEIEAYLRGNIFGFNGMTKEARNDNSHCIKYKMSAFGAWKKLKAAKFDTELPNPVWKGHLFRILSNFVHRILNIQSQHGELKIHRNEKELLIFLKQIIPRPATRVSHRYCLVLLIFALA